MQKNSVWEVEDTFFGALLGAFLGTLAVDLSIWHAALIIFFIILFPMSLRKLEKISAYFYVGAIILSIFWMGLYILEISLVLKTSWESGGVLFLIFIGWLVSITIRGRVKSI